MIRCLNVFLLFSFFFAQSEKAVQKGFLDLSTIDFKQEKQVSLSGDWHFAWRNLVDPKKIDSTRFRDYYPIPAKWNDSEKLNSNGFASYMLELKLADKNQDLALRIPPIYSAYVLYVNGVFFARNGSVGRKAEDSKPIAKVIVKELPKDTNRFQLLLQVSNFSHSNGGANEAIRIGAREELMAEHKLQISFDMLLVGGLAMGALFFIGMYSFGRREKAILYFALFCLSYIYRVLGYGLYYIYELFPNFNWEVAIRFEYASLYLSAIFFGNFVYQLYPKECSKRVVYFLSYYSILNLLLILLTPISFFTQLLIPFFLLLLLYIAYGLYVFVTAFLRKRDGAQYSLLSVAMIFLAFTSTMFNYFHFINENLWITFLAYVGFFFFQSLILSYRYSKVYENALILAESGTRAKSEFLAVMSHEIRTPLSGILMANDLLGFTELNEGQKKYTGIIKDSTESLITIIDDILDFSKIESGQIHLENKHFNLHQSIDDVINLLYPSAQKKELELYLSIDRAVSQYITADEIRFRQVLTNLLSNAIKFTKTGYILLKVRKHKSELEFSIQDTGVGISEEQIATVFKKFKQSDSSSKREYGGTGLGLSISKMLVEKMGGEIRLTSKEKVGTNVIFCLPLIDEKGSVEKDIEDKQILLFLNDKLLQKNVASFFKAAEISYRSYSKAITNSSFDIALVEYHSKLFIKDLKKIESLSEKLVFLAKGSDGLSKFKGHNFQLILKPFSMNKLTSTMRLVAEASSKIEKLNQKTKRILFAEDNDQNRDIISEYLKQIGIKHDLARNGLEVLSKFEEKAYDIILLDIQMPEMDGLEACKQIRELSKETKIIALTANVMKSDVDLYMRSGFDDCIAKPIDTKVLYEKLEALFK